MKKVIVTGCTGFIGGALTAKLLSSGVFVFGVDINKDKMLQLYGNYQNFSAVQASYEDYENLHQLITVKDIDVFYHFAWAGGFSKALRDIKLQYANAMYSNIAVEQAVKIGTKKFVYASTVNAYELNKYISMDNFQPRNTFFYSTLKNASEFLGKTIATFGKIDYCVGRIAMCFGENNKAEVLPNIVMLNALNKQPINLIEGNNLYDMIYIDDIVDAFIAIGEKGKHMMSYYVGHRKVGTFKDIVSRMAYAIDKDAVLNFGVYPEPPTGIDYNNIDTDALYRDTGFECKANFEQSVNKTAEWLKNNIGNR